MRAILFMGSKDNEEAYRIEFSRAIPNIDFRIYPNVGDIDDIEYALVKRPLMSDFGIFPNLRAIISLTVGLDQFENVEVPSTVPLIRMLDEGHIVSMAEFVLHSVLYYHRRFFDYESQKECRTWRSYAVTPSSQRKIGFMGIGAMAKRPAIILRDLGFSVSSWSRTPKSIAGIESFHGKNALFEFLRRLDILVCLLPLNKDTENILNSATLSELPIGASVINAGRGKCLDEGDLIMLLNNNHIGGATLDVFQHEPLDVDSPLWGHPRIRITPHIAGKADIAKATEFIKCKIEDTEDKYRNR